MADADKKTCSKCRELKPITSFTSQGAGRFRSRCRRCTSEDTRGYYAKLKPEIRDGRKHRARAKRFGLTLERYEELISNAGPCPICGAAEPGGHGEWHIDHNHETGKIRGILCANCNLALGHFKDNRANLERANAYLEVNDG